jgi:hypothetical protein
MRDDNPLNNFDTRSYSQGLGDYSAPSVCPSFSQATANPLKLVDYISCHKLLLIFILAIVAFLAYSGVKAKVKEGEKSGNKGEAPKTK